LENIKPFKRGIHFGIFVLHVGNKKRIHGGQDGLIIQPELINHTNDLIRILEPIVLHIEVKPQRLAKLLEHLSQCRDAVRGCLALEQQLAAFDSLPGQFAELHIES
jgi:hypothetical protein